MAMRICGLPRRLPASYLRFAPATLHAGGRRLQTTVQDNPFLYSKPGLAARIIDGQKIAKAVRAEVADKVSQLVSKGIRPPSLCALLVGGDNASRIYVKKKMEAAKKCGLRAEVIERSKDVSEEEVLEVIEGLKRNEEVDGILVQLPLPPHINEKLICNFVSTDKDVDGFNNENIGYFCSGDPHLVPATPLAVLEIIKRLQVPTFGKNVCIANRSKNIGFTLAALLHSDGTGDATTTICHRYTPPEQLSVMTQIADIVIVATGIPGLIKRDMVKEGATVIDIGITRLENNKIVGDVDFDGVGQVASLLTPVPGGVGPLTVAMVIKNTLRAAEKDFRFDFSSIH